MTTSRELAIDQVAQLFPYLSPGERLTWWERLGCKLAELTTYMPTDQEKYAAIIAERDQLAEPSERSEQWEAPK